MKFTSLPQKLILSASILSIGVIIAKSISLSIYSSKYDNLSDSWWIWIAFILVQGWLQLKIWDSKELNFSYAESKVWLTSKFSPLKDRIKGFTLPKIGFKIPSIFIISFFLVIGLNLYLNYQKNRNFSQPKVTTSKQHLPITMSKEVSERIREFDSIRDLQNKTLPEKSNTNSSSSVISEFSNGNTKTYTSDGHGKSKGLILSIQYPSNYTESEVDRPNVVVKLSSPNSTCEVNILVKKYPYTITSEQKNSALSNTTLEMTAKAMGLELLSNARLTIDGEQAAYMDTYIEANDANSTFRTYKRTYYAYYKSYALEIHFYIGDYKSKETLESRFVDYKPLFSKMIKTLTFRTATN